MPVITCPQCGANWRVPLGPGLHVVAKCLKCGHRFELDTEVTREATRQEEAMAEPGTASPSPRIAPTIWLEKSPVQAKAEQPSDGSDEAGAPAPTAIQRVARISARPGVSHTLKILGWIFLFIAVGALFFLFALLKP